MKYEVNITEHQFYLHTLELEFENEKEIEDLEEDELAELVAGREGKLEDTAFELMDFEELD